MALLLEIGEHRDGAGEGVSLPLVEIWLREHLMQLGIADLRG